MKHILIFILTAIFIQAKAQDENKFQPDSVYQTHKVKRIYVYENSPKDLSKIIDLDTNGHKIKLVDYDASYDKKTRARKGVSSTWYYFYDPEKKLVEETDSASYSHSSAQTDHTFYFYGADGILKTSIYCQGDFLSTSTAYSVHPFRKIVIRRHDSLITSLEAEEYDRDFYEKRSYGYSWTPTLKIGHFIHGTDTTTYQYSDDKDLKKLSDSTEITNRFNSKGQLLSSYIDQRFMPNIDTWRTFRANLTYKYYANGLLKSIFGYIPEYFKYEFYK